MPFSTPTSWEIHLFWNPHVSYSNQICCTFSHWQIWTCHIFRTLMWRLTFSEIQTWSVGSLSDVAILVLSGWNRTMTHIPHTEVEICRFWFLTYPISTPIVAAIHIFSNRDLVHSPHTDSEAHFFGIPDMVNFHLKRRGNARVWLPDTDNSSLEQTRTWQSMCFAMRARPIFPRRRLNFFPNLRHM